MAVINGISNSAHMRKHSWSILGEWWLGQVVAGDKAGEGQIIFIGRNYLGFGGARQIW